MREAIYSRMKPTSLRASRIWIMERYQRERGPADSIRSESDSENVRGKVLHRHLLNRSGRFNSEEMSVIKKMFIPIRE